MIFFSIFRIQMTYAKNLLVGTKVKMSESVFYTKASFFFFL